MKEGLTVIVVGGFIAAGVLFWLTRGTQAQRNKKGIGCLSTIGIGLILICATLWALPNRKKEYDYTPTSTAPRQPDDDQEVRYAVKYAVERTLKAPSTAKFQNPDDFKVIKLGKNVWEVSGYVDSQNSFGAMLRSNFKITLAKMNGEWKALDAVMK